MEKQWVRDFQDKGTVDSWFLVRDKHVGLGKNGKAFLSLVIGDKTGTVDARVWDRIEEMAELFQVGDVVKIKGTLQTYQNRIQLIVQRLERMVLEVFPQEELIPATQKDVAGLFRELVGFVESVENDHIRQLLMETIEDQEIRPLLMKSPAAKSIHHAWIGGLIEHIVSILKIMDFMSKHYSFLNRDLLIFGAIYHDIGKVWELSIEGGTQYTEKGRLLGHLYIGAELVEKKASRLMLFPEELKWVLKHIVLSHHGKLEFGSPKRPKFLEAMVVAMVDDLDSKVISLQSLLDNERQHSKDRWSRYMDLFERTFLLDHGL